MTTKSLIIFVVAFVIVAAIQLFRKKNMIDKKSDFLEAGQLLYNNDKDNFIDFFNLYLKDEKKFKEENEELLEEYEFEGKLKPIEVVYIFGDKNGKLFMTDWRGEENAREIEEFIENKLSIKPTWTNVDKLRSGANENQKRDGKYIIELFKEMDKDLSTINKKMIFLELGWDAYVYTVVDLATYKNITDRLNKDFHGTEKLKK